MLFLQEGQVNSLPMVAGCWLLSSVLCACDFWFLEAQFSVVEIVMGD
jgi:hypothetical protein